MYADGVWRKRNVKRKEMIFAEKRMLQILNLEFQKHSYRLEVEDKKALICLAKCLPLTLEAERNMI